MIDGEVNRQAMMIAFLDSFLMLAIVLHAVAFLASDDSGYITGTVIPVGGGDLG